MLLAMTSDNILLPEVYDAADSVIAQKLRQISGIGEVFIGGGARPAVRVQVNPGLMNTYGISLENVRTVLERCQFQSSQRAAHQRRACLGRFDHRSAVQGARVSAADCHLAQRLAGAAGRHRHGQRFGRRRAQRRLHQRPIRHRPGDFPPARRQHDRDRRSRARRCCRNCRRRSILRFISA